MKAKFKMKYDRSEINVNFLIISPEPVELETRLFGACQNVIKLSTKSSW